MWLNVTIRAVFKKIHWIHVHSPGGERRPAWGEEESRRGSSQTLSPGNSGGLPSARAGRRTGRKHTIDYSSFTLNSRTVQQKSHNLPSVNISKQRAVKKMWTDVA